MHSPMIPLLPVHAATILGADVLPWDKAAAHPLTLAGMKYDAAITFDGPNVDGVLVTTDFDIDVDGPTASKAVDKYWQPETSLRWSGGSSVSSLHHPGVVISPKLNAFGVRVSDYCLAVYNGRMIPAQVYDIGPTAKAGEGSLYLGRKLGIVSVRESDKHAATFGNSATDVVTLFFPNTGPGHAVAPDLIADAVALLWKTFTGDRSAVLAA